MPGISLLRPQYTSLGTVATRLAGGARQVAHETDQSALSALVEGRAAGGQDDVIVQEVTAASFEHSRDQGSGRQAPQEHPVAAAAPREAAGDFSAEAKSPPAERAPAFGLLVAAPLAMPERLRAAEQAYGYSREVLRMAGKPGGTLNSAS